MVQFILAGCQWAYIGDWASIFLMTRKSGFLLETGSHKTSGLILYTPAVANGSGNVEKLHEVPSS